MALWIGVTLTEERTEETKAPEKNGTTPGKRAEAWVGKMTFGGKSGNQNG